MNNKPIYVSPENTERIVGRDAQRNNILAARVLAETIKTTLGPKGMDKMLVDSAGEITITNDGVTILSEMEIEHPVAKMLVEIAKTQEKEVGDGTTTAVMLAGKLLENAEKLLDQKVHPTIIAKGYRLAAEKSLSLLNELCAEISSEEELIKIVQTAMTGKGAEYSKEKLSHLLVEALKQIAEDREVNLENIKIEKRKGKSISDSELIKGIILEKEKISSEMPQKITNAKIVLIESPIEIKSLDKETRISISSPEQLQNFLNQEEETMTALIEKIISSGANCLICQRGISEIAKYHLTKKGIYSLERVPRQDIQKIAHSTNAKIISNTKEISQNDLGFASSVEEITENNEKLTYILGCKNPKAVTLIIRGGTEHVLEEVERAVKDSLGDLATVTKDRKVVAGGGAIEIELSRRLKQFAKSFVGRESLSIEQFALALEFIPSSLAENAGLDPMDILTEIRALHETGNTNAGLNLLSNKIENTLSSGIIEPLKVKTQAISSATEVANMILRIDDVIASGKPKQKSVDLQALRDYE